MYVLYFNMCIVTVLSTVIRLINLCWVNAHEKRDGFIIFSWNIAQNRLCMLHWLDSYMTETTILLEACDVSGAYTVPHALLMK